MSPTTSSAQPRSRTTATLRKALLMGEGNSLDTSRIALHVIFSGEPLLTLEQQETRYDTLVSTMSDILSSRSGYDEYGPWWTDRSFAHAVKEGIKMAYGDLTGVEWEETVRNIFFRDEPYQRWINKWAGTTTVKSTDYSAS